MKLLYLSTWDFSNEKSDGVCKKIYSQIAVFEKHGYEVDFIYLKDGNVFYKEGGQERIIGHVGNIKKTPAYIKMYKSLKNKKYDWVYNRYGMMDTFYYCVLKRLHRNGAKILIEIPTYPYTGEKEKGILYQFMFWWDKLYINKLEKIIDRIVTYSRDNEIFGISTIKTMNGVDVEAIKPVQRADKMDSVIDLLMVALMQPHHGYERLIKGLYRYYQNGGMRGIFCHFIGDGPERKYYEDLTAKYKLKDHVKFYGMKSGEELDQIYNKADIGVCSLGCYKKSVYWVSELKAGEYLARGIPIIIGVEENITNLIEKNYYLQFPNDDSEIEFEKIITFYDRVYGEGENGTVKRIRDMAQDYIDMKATMLPICSYIDKVENG